MFGIFSVSRIIRTGTPGNTEKFSPLAFLRNEKLSSALNIKVFFYFMRCFRFENDLKTIYCWKVSFINVVLCFYLLTRVPKFFVGKLLLIFNHSKYVVVSQKRDFAVQWKFCSAHRASVKGCAVVRIRATATKPS